MQEPRDPLKKEKFLEGNRQKWAALGVSAIAVVLICDLFGKIDAKPYIEAIAQIVTVGLVGWSVDSAWKIYRTPRSRDYIGSNPNEAPYD